MYLFYLAVILFRPLKLENLEMEVNKMDRKLILDVAKQMRKLADSIEAYIKDKDMPEVQQLLAELRAARAV